MSFGAKIQFSLPVTRLAPIGYILENSVCEVDQWSYPDRTRLWHLQDAESKCQVYFIGKAVKPKGWALSSEGAGGQQREENVTTELRPLEVKVCRIEGSEP